MRITRTAGAVVFAALGAAATTAAVAPTAGAQTDCVKYIRTDGTEACMPIVPANPGATGSFGYGSAGTRSLADLSSQLVVTGSDALSLQLPLAVGSIGQTPGSTGSYGPEAVVGQLSATTVGSLIQGSLGS